MNWESKKGFNGKVRLYYEWAKTIFFWTAVACVVLFFTLGTGCKTLDKDCEAKYGPNGFYTECKKVEQEDEVDE